MLQNDYSYQNDSNSFGNDSNSFGNDSISFGNDSNTFGNDSNYFGNGSNLIPKYLKFSNFFWKWFIIVSKIFGNNSKIIRFFSIKVGKIPTYLESFPKQLESFPKKL